ncbi:MAG: hypothetical protein JXR44_04630 [Thiotrichales bacterium]|nr:hypothetical protein [Thiotrichales bacterium]
MVRKLFTILAGLALAGCSQKPIPWVKQQSIHLVEQLGYERDRGPYVQVPNYYRDSNQPEAENAGQRRYLNEPAHRTVSE